MEPWNVIWESEEENIIKKEVYKKIHVISIGAFDRFIIFEITTMKRTCEKV